jgi:hypothetical protein
MSSSPEAFHEQDKILEPHTQELGERSAPFVELAHGDGYRWAALDVADLDPPTPILPYTAN